MISSRLLVVAAFLGSGAIAQQYVISTVAGGAPPPKPVSAADAPIGLAIGVATDVTGGVYFAVADLNSVFKLDPEGVLTRVAGNTMAGYSGDGGPATSAELRLGLALALASPVGVAVDSAGNLFVADRGNQRVRRISPAGIITTVAGTGERGFSDDGGQPPARN